MMIKAWCDGSSLKGGGAGAGVALKVIVEGEVVENHNMSLPLPTNATNNEAEYQAILLAVKKSIQLGFGKYAKYPFVTTIYSDSELAVEQINGNYRVKNKNLKTIHSEICDLIDSASGAVLEVIHIPRNENEQADALSRTAALLSAAQYS